MTLKQKGGGPKRATASSLWREEFCDLGRSVARSVRKHVSTRDEPKAQKDRA